METYFIVGNSYSIKEIEEKGFINTKTTSIKMIYRKDKILMTFIIPELLKPRLYKLSSICND